MNLSIRRIGGSSRTPAKIIEMIVSTGGSSIETDITNLKGRVDDDLIQSLRQIADELQEQNDLIDNKNSEQ